MESLSLPLRGKFPYSEFFWSTFFRIRTEYGEIYRISPYSVRMRKNTEQKNSEQGHFSYSVPYMFFPPLTQQTYVCLETTIETLGKGVKYLQS